jgi:hypothetical protein
MMLKKFGLCRILSSVLVLMAVINQLLRHDEYRRPNGPMETISKLSMCCVLFSMVELLKTLGGRILSLRVHSSSRVFSKLRVLCPLYKTLPDRCGDTYTLGR